MNRTSVLALALSSVWAATPQAQDNDDSYLEETITTAHPLSAEGISQSTTVLDGYELEQKVAGNIGATLAKEPGIHTANFGNAVGRPVIHGLGGPRVRVMEDRIDTLDVSVTSADHAVNVEPFIADRIEVIKGPSTLLYGTGAIGGVVDVHTGRIPHEVPDDVLSGGIETRYDSNTEGNATSFKFNGGAGNWAWHLDGSFRDGDEYEIPGFAESARLRAEEEAEGGEEEGEEEARDILPGSAFDSASYAGGLSYVSDWGFIGAAVSAIDADYGLPGGHGHEEGEEEEEEEEEGNPLLDMEQTRVDIELGINNPFGPFKSANVRLGVNDYEHMEIEPSGEVATLFTNEAWELRSELVYESTNWHGAVGLQHTDREFSATGEEAFVPPVDTRDTSLFWIAERKYENFDFETGARIGIVEHTPLMGASRDFTTYAVSAGFVVPASDALRFGLNADLSSRAPVGEELFSNGPHLVTNAFEIGDPELDNESAFNLAGTAQFNRDGLSASATAYYTRFSDFIYETGTGGVEDGLPVFTFVQNDAVFYGLEAEVSRRMGSWEGGSWDLRGMVDLVEAELDVNGNDNVPRIPPVRFGLGAQATWGDLSVSVDFLRATEQDNVTEQELITDAYNDLSAYVSYDYSLPRGTLNLFLSGRNLTDDDQRNHTSFIKDFAPAPGRTVELGLRYTF